MYIMVQVFFKKTSLSANKAKKFLDFMLI
jgi:hypothetical protein